MLIWLRAILLRILNGFFRKEESNIPKDPKKLLVCNIAHLGDVIISTSVLPLLKQRYPDAQIDFLAGSHAAHVLLKHPLIDHVRIYNHPMMNRKVKKWLSALRLLTGENWLWSREKIEGYDIAIDLYSYFPNAIPILRKIPVRIGFGTGGFSNMLTHVVPWYYEDCYIGQAHLHLLELLGIDITNASPLPDYRLTHEKSDEIVIHVASSTPKRDWELDKWIELIQKLGKKIVLTGHGERDKKRCQIIAKKTNALNLCNALDFPAFVKRIQQAKLLICTETVAMHIAAASHTPMIALWTYRTKPQMWAPPHAKIISIKATPSEVLSLCDLWRQELMPR